MMEQHARQRQEEEERRQFYEAERRAQEEKRRVNQVLSFSETPIDDYKMKQRIMQRETD